MKSLSVRSALAGASAIAVVLATVGVAPASAAPPGASPAAVAAKAQGVIVVLKNQHTDLTIAKGHSSPRIIAAQRDQAPLIAKAERLGARSVHGFTVLNGFSATATQAQVAQLTADPAVAAVYPDLQISKPATAPAESASAATGAAAAPAPGVCPSDPSKPQLEPEALQVTNTAFDNPKTPQAQNLVTGTGVKVAFLADGIDINNPDFIRADGSHVFADYQDFSGEGPDAPSSAAEAFGDASSIAAQGRQVYDVANFVDPAHPLPAGCTIRILGVAPGASLVGLKVFGNANTAPTSRFIEAIDYAVNVAGVDVINESFGANPFPDNGNDPITLADNAAVDAGVTVVASTGDSGTTGTIGSPASGAKIISVAATTTFRFYQQIGNAGVGFSNGTYADNNISALSSGGITQQNRVPDLAAPGDSGWAICTPNPDVYIDCTNADGDPSPILDFGGTSQSSPLTAGAAALVIQAYEKTHHGARPTPALVKQLLTGTATDLGHPAYEQGAGLLNTLAAVRAAMSWKDANGSPAPTGTALVVDKTQLSVSGNPGTSASTGLTVRNVSGHSQTVNLGTRTIGKTVSSATGKVALNTATAPAYIDAFGIARSYVSKKFSVPMGVDRLDVAFAVKLAGAGRVILIDPHGTYEAYSIPQGSANYGHVDVHFPAFGVWTAYFALSKSTGFNGTITYGVTTSKFTTYGSVSPSRITLAPGASRTVKVNTPLPKQPGDVSASVQLTTALGVTTSVPVSARAVIPSALSTTFKGTITGGNGRAAGGEAQGNSYYLNVPAGRKDLGIGVTLDTDRNVGIMGYLTAPDGQVYSFQTNLTDAANNAGFQIYRRDPTPGRWVFSLETLDPATGLQLSQHFTVRVAYNTVKITAPALPNSRNTTLVAGKPVSVPVKVTNTGVVPLTYFADGRLTTVGDIPLAELSGDSTNIPLPVPAGVTPFWLVPSESSQVIFAAAATQPVNLDVFYQSGEPEVYSAAQGNGAVVQVDARQVSPGVWAADIGQSGPFAGPAPTGTVSVAAVARGQLFDPAVTSLTGDFWQVGVNPAANPALTALVKGAKPTLFSGGARSMDTAASEAAQAPITVRPGASATIHVTITPKGKVGSVVTGHLYIDTVNLITDSGDELISLPYTYKIG